MIDHGNHADDCAVCPRCQLRDRLTAAFTDALAADREDLLEQLLDNVQALRAVDVADDDELEEAVAYAVAETLNTFDVIAQTGLPPRQI